MARLIKTSVHGRRLGLDKIDALVVGKEIDGFSFSPAKGGSANICLVTIQALNNEDQAVVSTDFPDTPVLVWLSDSATGAGLTATTPSGGIAAGATGNVLGVLTTSKAIMAQMINGVFILSITDTAKTGFYVCARNFAKPFSSFSAQLTSANYD